MPLPNNLELLAHCNANPEPFTESHYEKEHVIITDSPDRPNALMTANRQIIDSITAYGVCIETGQLDACDAIIERIVRALRADQINNSEFTSYWEVNDVSFSIYRGLPDPEKRRFLHEMVRRYLDRRHAMYSVHGYTATTLQVKADSFAHKRSGGLGRQKVTAILAEHGIARFDGPPDRFVTCTSGFILPDGGDSAAFTCWKNALGVEFTWAVEHAGKGVDFLISFGGHWLVVEHKHMKEGGGGQDKQLVEVAEFVAYSEQQENIHYVSFIDGIIFATLATATGKTRSLYTNIHQYLKENPRNYFVNTCGFKSILKWLSPSVS